MIAFQSIEIQRVDVNSSEDFTFKDLNLKKLSNIRGASSL